MDLLSSEHLTCRRLTACKLPLCLPMCFCSMLEEHGKYCIGPLLVDSEEKYTTLAQSGCDYLLGSLFLTNLNLTGTQKPIPLQKIEGVLRVNGVIAPNLSSILPDLDTLCGYGDADNSLSVVNTTFNHVDLRSVNSSKPQGIVASNPGLPRENVYGR